MFTQRGVTDNILTYSTQLLLYVVCKTTTTCTVSFISSRNNTTVQINKEVNLPFTLFSSRWIIIHIQCVSSLAVAITSQIEVQVPAASCQATGPLLPCMQSGQSCVTAVGPYWSPLGSSCYLWPSSRWATFNPNWPQLERNRAVIMTRSFNFTFHFICVLYQALFIQVSNCF